MTETRSLAETTMDPAEILALPKHQATAHILSLQCEVQAYKKYLKALKKSCWPADFHALVKGVQTIFGVALPPSFSMSTTEDDGLVEIPHEPGGETEVTMEVDTRLASPEMKAVEGPSDASMMQESPQKIHLSRWRRKPVDDTTPVTLPEERCSIFEGSLVITQDLKVNLFDLIGSKEKTQDITCQISPCLFYQRVSSMFGAPLHAFGECENMGFFHRDGSQMDCYFCGNDFRVFSEGTEQSQKDTIELLEFLVANHFYLDKRHVSVQIG